MAPSAKLVDPEAEFKTQFGLPDFSTFPERYGWATENERGYKFAEQLCGTERMGYLLACCCVFLTDMCAF